MIYTDFSKLARGDVIKLRYDGWENDGSVVRISMIHKTKTKITLIFHPNDVIYYPEWNNSKIKPSTAEIYKKRTSPWHYEKCPQYNTPLFRVIFKQR